MNTIQRGAAGPLHLARWQALNSGQQAAVRAVPITAEQVEFAGSVDRAIAACEAASLDEVAGLALLSGEHVLGFLVLSRAGARPDWAPPQAVALTAMRIDQTHQGQGLGREALHLARAWLQVHWPQESTLALLVDEQNVAGRRAYARAGFTACAEPRPGRIGWVHALARPVADPVDGAQA